MSASRSDFDDGEKRYINPDVMRHVFLEEGEITRADIAEVLDA